MKFSLTEMVNTLCQQWHRDPLLTVLEITGTISSMLAATLLSAQLAGMITIFVIWCVGSVCLTISSHKRNNPSMLMLMLFYTVLNILGIGNLL